MFFLYCKKQSKGNGCEAIGKAVTSDTRDARFIFSHGQILFTISCIITERPGMVGFKKQSKAFHKQKAKPWVQIPVTEKISVTKNNDRAKKILIKVTERIGTTYIW